MKEQERIVRDNDFSEPSDDDYPGLLGARIRRARARRGMTRKRLSHESGISERYLAELEAGRGNASIALLRQIAGAMNVALVELVDDRVEPPVEFELLVERLRALAADDLGEARRLLLERFGDGAGRQGRIALIGLRGAGKSTLGQALAAELNLPFLQVNAEIEREVGVSLDEIFNLMGQAAYRRLERRALDSIVERHARAVIETGGGLIADAGTFERLLSSCYTIWLRASPEEHMARVVAQGDYRPMAGNREAMADLRRILAGREALYGKADAVLDTSRRNIRETLADLAQIARQWLARSDAA